VCCKQITYNPCGVLQCAGAATTQIPHVASRLCPFHVGHAQAAGESATSPNRPALRMAARGNVLCVLGAFVHPGRLSHPFNTGQGNQDDGAPRLAQASSPCKDAIHDSPCTTEHHIFHWPSVHGLRMLVHVYVVFQQTFGARSKRYCQRFPQPVTMRPSCLVRQLPCILHAGIMTSSLVLDMSSPRSFKDTVVVVHPVEPGDRMGPEDSQLVWQQI
jgi:hypothetical protein